MKKIIFLSFITLSLALLSNAQLKVGIRAGLNQNNQRINVTEGNLFAQDDLKGFHAGVMTDLNLGHRFYLQPQLLFSRKGAAHHSSVDAGVCKIRMNYLEMPVNVVYKINLPFGKAFAGTGATYSYAIGAKALQDGTTTNLFKGTTGWQRHDLSLNFTTGLQFDNGLIISLNSQKGLMDINKSPGTSVRNKSMLVSVGYLIDWKKLSRKV